ncbi:MAG: DegT/DnrJ/EryC1/StrS family aminotransferase [Chlamydiae bacterium]|nr:DegT/DnrJ/EryC1/StrS family aminotransferase [Chlamydiota bacterium]
MKEPIQLFRPELGAEELEAVRQVFESKWLGLGPKTAEFEKAFASYIGAGHVVGTNSCTAALELAVKLLDPSPGDEILVPAITFVSTAHVVVYNRCRPVFVDVDPATLNISPEDLRRKITSKTRAIVLVHYSGRPAEMDAILEIAGDIPVIEDCAHATGAFYRGRHVGSFGRFGCFSFHAVKNLTMGEGGAITMGDLESAQRAKRLRWLGIDKGTWDRTPDNKSYWWEYNVDEIGLKCHPNDILAAIGLVQLGKLKRMNDRRREIVARYRRAFADLPWLEMPPDDDEVHRSAWHICAIRCRGVDRDNLSVYLREKQIFTGVHYKPIHLYRCYGWQPPLPVAEAVFPRLLSLPNHSVLTDAEVERIIDAVVAYPC